jgi:hypothetical protein
LRARKPLKRAGENSHISQIFLGEPTTHPHAPGVNCPENGIPWGTNGFWFWCELYAKRGITAQLRDSLAISAIKDDGEHKEQSRSFKDSGFVPVFIGFDNVCKRSGCEHSHIDEYEYIVSEHSFRNEKIGK